MQDLLDGRMSQTQLQNIEQLESDLWAAADQLRANSKLTSSEYCMPVLGIIFLSHATNRYDDAVRQIAADQAAGKMPKRAPIKADFLKRRALMLPKEARYGELRGLPKGASLGTALVKAMDAIERDFEPLLNVLPKDYDKFESDLLEDILRIFDSDTLRTASGDVFGRIYEYFLMKFAMQGAQDNGEFFTPPSLVQTIVNVIEPDHGIVCDLACGSAGMFVQSSHFIERHGHDASHRVSFFGQEKTATTIRLAKMNLAVHGLEGNIREANTFYEDVHRLKDGKPLFGNCDFVMANPPFNVDMVDAEKVKDDRRLPFGLPGVNKAKKVSNGNYLWISYFYSYLGPKGRAGFVMSSQASSAGHGEAEVRRKLVETGDVDVMVSIRSNFFYTRTVPCELWHLDKGKPADRRDQVLMLDARNIYRKVTRKIYDFAPEQLQNLSAIVWLYRGQSDRFHQLICDYFDRVGQEAEQVSSALSGFEFAFGAVDEVFINVRTEVEQPPLDLAAGASDFLAAADELFETYTAYSKDRDELESALARFHKKYEATPPSTKSEQHAARKAFDPIAERLRGMVKQIDLVFKLADRAAETARTVLAERAKGEDYDEELDHFVLDRRRLARLVKEMDAKRKEAVEQLRQPVYFHRQAVWLLDRFPDGKLSDVPGLVKLVSRADIEAADWSLTPGRYVGVAPAEVDEDFDFEQTLRDIHTELADLNQEAVALAATIQRNFEELGI
jgi:type I restriction enzyme M protein